MENVYPISDPNNLLMCIPSLIQTTFVKRMSMKKAQHLSGPGNLVTYVSTENVLPTSDPDNFVRPMSMKMHYVFLTQTHLCQTAVHGKCATHLYPRQLCSTGVQGTNVNPSLAQTTLSNRCPWKMHKPISGLDYFVKQVSMENVQTHL